MANGGRESENQPMSVLISSSPPLSTLFIDMCQVSRPDTPSSPFTSPQLVRKSGKKQTYLPLSKPVQLEARRRSVIFADSIGLPLTQIKILKNEDTLPIEDAQNNTLKSPLNTDTVPTKLSPINTIPGLSLNFPQPRTQLDFLQRVRTCHVSLENVVIDHFTLVGTILVHNIDFQKVVNVRYTKDYWLSYIEIPASYDRSIATDIDKFSFKLKIPESLPPGARLEFCVQYQVGGVAFWDNNNHNNYQIECKMIPVKTAELEPLYHRLDRRYFPPFPSLLKSLEEDNHIYY